ncbi:MAG: FAD-dependent oxidoreductase [Verrucomicrobiota bacterium]|nr:FAD-dependent oxidoreductase [Verrucomicrobiota bacterium]
MNFTITIDGHNVDVHSGMSVLDAARKIGIDIPTLCYLEKCGPINSCLVCLVKLNGKLVPACGTKVQPGMAIESETQEVHDARRTALELILSDHVGDCLAPCHRLCPLDLNVPLMLRHVTSGKLDQAIATVQTALPMPRILGRLCHHPCEQGCRRGAWDKPLAIRDTERMVADTNAASPAPRVPHPKPSSGKSVAVIGAGPTGLAAAWFLALEGHSVTVFDRKPRPGGTLRAVDPNLLPPDVLESELDLFTQLRIKFEPNTEVGQTVALQSIESQFAAVLIATGQPDDQKRPFPDVQAAGGSIEIDSATFHTKRSSVFAAGSAVHPVRHLVRALSEGKAVAHCISLALDGKPARRPPKQFSSVIGRLERAELEVFVRSASAHNRQTETNKQTGPDQTTFAAEAARCLHCDCRAAGNCDLQRYAEVYNANAGRFKGNRRPFEQQWRPGGIIFEPGKCVLCGVCVKLAELGGEPLGLAFVGRGFNVRLAAPFGHSVDDGLQQVGAECVAQCPTGALSTP